MILDAITLHNFRQFYGTQRIFFSKDKSKNVTVILGENGSGKTALLNAFSWCLFGQTDLPDREDILSEKAVAEAADAGELEAYVKLEFNEGLKTYYVTRSVRGKKLEGNRLEYSEPVLTLEYTDETGKTVVPPHPQATINRIIPEALRTYFFFQGETSGNLTQKEGAEEIKKAIRVLMGLEILEQTAKDLEEAKKSFRHESAAYGDPEAQKLVQEIEELERQLSEKNEDLRGKIRNRDLVESEILGVQDKLRSLGASKDLQERKDTLLDQERKVYEQIKDVRTATIEVLAQRGYLAFCGNLVKETNVFLREKLAGGEIPLEMNHRFVAKLLEKGECICGNGLKGGAARRVEEWLKAADPELEEKFLNLFADVRLMEHDRIRLFDELRRLRSFKDNLLLNLKEIQEEIAEITAKMEGQDVAEVAALARKERELKSALKEMDEKVGRIKGDISSLEKTLKAKQEELGKKPFEGEAAGLAKRRMDICENIRKTLEEVLSIQSEDVQNRLQQKIANVYSRMLHKSYEAVIDSEYNLSFYKYMGDQRIPVRMSQGERQVTSLAFVGAIVDVAREQTEDKSFIEFGGEYPIVLDSPFGQLDEDHRKRTALCLPSLSNQVIVMVSGSQWKGPVEEEMKANIGRIYHLAYHDPKENPAVKFEYTEIQEGEKDA
ncbi:MAG TPA: AAA family ATPase [Firmicutes bacterium]|jgi:DNA sulfur modification protein DndD|nr:AAA family ATPase [Bacillota bacterium]HOQ24468.1 AAA family ATPase [Bacillota bacterium]HPT68183.1 AAA family ATPase [Bacillota bacterium]